MTSGTERTVTSEKHRKPPLVAYGMCAFYQAENCGKATNTKRYFDWTGKLYAVRHYCNQHRRQA